MAHLVNPISFRLGYNRYWNSLWASSSKNVASLNVRDVLISQYITRTFERTQEVLRSSWSLANLKVFSVSCFIFIFFFLKYQQFNVSELFYVFNTWWTKLLKVKNNKRVKFVKKNVKKKKVHSLKLKRSKLLKKNIKNYTKQKKRSKFKSFFLYPTRCLFKRPGPLVPFSYSDFKGVKFLKNERVFFDKLQRTGPIDPFSAYVFDKRVTTSKLKERLYFRSISKPKKHNRFNLMRHNFLFEKKYIATRIYKHAYIPTLATVRYARYDSFLKLHDVYLNNYLFPFSRPLKWNPMHSERPWRDQLPRPIMIKKPSRDPIPKPTLLDYHVGDQMYPIYWINVDFTRMWMVEREKKMKRDTRNSFIKHSIRSLNYNRAVKLRDQFSLLFLKRRRFALRILKKIKQKSLSSKFRKKLRKKGVTSSIFKAISRKYRISRNIKFFISSKIPLNRKKRALFLKFKFFKLFYLIYYFLFFKYKILFFKRIFFYDLKKFFGSKTQVYIYCVLLPIESFTARYIARFIRLKLLHKYPLRNIMRLMVGKLNLAILANEINGFKLQFCGRFTRKDRATYAWKRFGKVTLNEVAGRVDYALVLVVLVNSMCGLKVWISRLSVIQRTLVF